MTLWDLVAIEVKGKIQFGIIEHWDDSKKRFCIRMLFGPTRTLFRTPQQITKLVSGESLYGYMLDSYRNVSVSDRAVS